MALVRFAHASVALRPELLTVEAQYGGRQWRRVGEGELDRVLSRPLQQLLGLLAFLLLPLFPPFLLLSGENLLSLLLLNGNK